MQNTPPLDKQHPETNRAYVLFILVVVYTFNFIDRQIVGILAVPIKADLLLTDTQLGLMGGLAFALFYTGLGIPVAMLADRFSRTWIMTAALVIWSGMTAASGLATNFWQLFSARLGVGVGEAGGVAPAYSLIADYFPPNAARAGHERVFIWHSHRQRHRHRFWRHHRQPDRLALGVFYRRYRRYYHCADIPHDHQGATARWLRPQT